MYSVGVPIKFPWKRSVRTIMSGKFQRQIKSCLQISSCSTMHDEKAKKTGEIIISVVQNLTCELPQFLQFLRDCTRLKDRAILRTFQNHSYLLITNCTRGRAISYTNTFFHISLRVCAQCSQGLHVYPIKDLYEIKSIEGCKHPQTTRRHLLL